MNPKKITAKHFRFQGGAKAILTSRPIAPAPVPTASHLPTALPISVSATAQVVSGQTMQKVPVLTGGLGNALHDSARHISVGHGGTPMAVNLSGTQTIAVHPTGATSVQTQSVVQSALSGGLHTSSGGIMTSQVCQVNVVGMRF